MNIKSQNTHQASGKFALISKLNLLNAGVAKPGQRRKVTLGLESGPCLLVSSWVQIPPPAFQIFKKTKIE